MMRFSVFRNRERHRLFRFFTNARTWSNITSKTTEDSHQMVNCSKLINNLVRASIFRSTCFSVWRSHSTNIHSVTLAQQKYPLNVIGSSSLPHLMTTKKSCIISVSSNNIQSNQAAKMCVTQQTRQLCTASNDKGGTCDSSKSSSHDSNKDIPLQQEEQEWVHPGTRQESILDKDPSLRSLLNELASDFGKSDANGGKPETKLGDITGATANAEGKFDTKLSDVSANEGDGADTYGVNLDYQEDIVHVEEEGPDSKMQQARKSGKTGVFSLSDVVEILQEENAKDMCVIKVPKGRGYVDYFIVVSGRSSRHLRAMVSNLNKTYKAAKGTADPFMKIEGKMADDWMCIDFGDIVIHFMMEEARELYELEMLWTLGPEYDNQYHRISQYQANVVQPVDLTKEELLEYEGAIQSQATEGYSVVITDGVGEGGGDDIPKDRRI